MIEFLALISTLLVGIIYIIAFAVGIISTFVLLSENKLPHDILEEFDTLNFYHLLGIFTVLPIIIFFTLLTYLLHGIYLLLRNPFGIFHKFMMTDPRDYIKFSIQIRRK